VGLALTGATVARSVDPLDAYGDAFGNRALVASGVADIVLSSLELAAQSGHNQIILPAPSAATARLARDIAIRGKSAAPYDVVVILVESQGLMRNEHDMRRVFAP